jgi:uncharacterized protein YcaQ
MVKDIRTTLERLQADAVRRNFLKAVSLKAALSRMGFVQADPIRSPARAQDLILRHRVRDYCAGDLERAYPRLNIEEDVLYAYGFLTRENWRLLHPRDSSGLSDLERKVLDIVGQLGRAHPRELDKHLGRERTLNAWGGYSKATTHALQRLHYRGLLRIVRRDEGIRIYQLNPPMDEHLSPQERLRQIVLLLAKIFAPSPLPSLQKTVQRLRYAAPALDRKSGILGTLLRSGELESDEFDGVRYIWPAGGLTRRPSEGAVRFLAPFDPLVWDRLRFEHLWGWRYRFEAYTPLEKRQLGYYAMPLLWRDAVIGWANVAVKGGKLTAKLGFVEYRPTDAEFSRELDREVELIRDFLGAANQYRVTYAKTPNIRLTHAARQANEG